MEVELVYSTHEKRLIQLQLTIPEGSTVNQTLEASGILNHYPEIKEMQAGVFSKPVEKDYPLKNGDRLEIYRPLSLNPMEKRRQRAKKSRKIKNINNN